ncbi:hypothetical protein, partial [Planktotalea frisia]|uniref:hypothetical protein n=1 Tax=Planktotalea frisia TaxID=696762 RepID=UPI001114EF54
MKYRNLKNWTNLNECKGLLFFAQRMDELTFSYTLDSYRAPTTTAPFLVQEAINSFVLCEKLETSPNSSFHILDELEERLKSNSIVKKMLNLHLESYIKYDRNQVSAIIRKLRVLERELDSRTYTLTGLELLKVAIKSGKKSEIDFLAKEISSSLQNLKVSGQHLNEMVVETFFSESKVEGEEVLEEFFRKLFPHSHNYDILVKIETSIGNVRKEVLRMFKMELSKKIPEHISEDELRHSFVTLNSKEDFFLLREIRAPDKFSAMASAIDKIDRLYDLFGLFHHKGSYTLSEFGIAVKICCEKTQDSIRTSVNRMHFVSDNRPLKAARKLDSMMEQVNFPRGVDKAKFFRAISFHGKCMQTESVYRCYPKTRIFSWVMTRKLS